MSWDGRLVAVGVACLFLTARAVAEPVPLREDAQYEVAGDSGVVVIGGRRYPGVSQVASMVGRTETGEPVIVTVLRAIAPRDEAAIREGRQLPIVAAVPMETVSGRSMQLTLRGVNVLHHQSRIDGVPLAQIGTMMLHGSAGIDDTTGLRRGRPTLRTVEGQEPVYLGPRAAAEVFRLMSPDDAPLRALINVGCHSSSPREASDLTFNQELASLLSPTILLGPPRPGTVKVNGGGGFTQQMTIDGESMDLQIAFSTIPKAPKEPRVGPEPLSVPSPEGARHATILITNQFALADASASFRPPPMGQWEELVCPRTLASFR